MSGTAESAFLPRSAFQKDLLYTLGGGDPRITIAVLDGPVDRTHECFRGARLTPIDDFAPDEFVTARTCNDRTMAQGSHTASVIFGQPCSAVEGQAPLCRGLLVPIFADGAVCTPQRLARAIVVAVDHGAQVIHVGGGAFVTMADHDGQLAKALALCLRRKVLIIAAAGRRGSAELLRAALAAPVLAVKAVEQLPSPGCDGALAIGGGCGIAMPGSRIFGAALEGRVARRSGACSAAALASSLAGLLLSRQLVTQDRADPLAVRHWLLDAACANKARGGYAVLDSQRDIERLAAHAGLAYPVTRSFGPA
ncbi:hypothetical protein BJ122_103192 [Rhodopseudomonas faecalis]|uniref:Peptidase S8/S53 domain-containing protein n=1 Tax=Rhodopseudomonas faecalis TaxID=99655 RepID=A0A318TL31_9BRAD|nr:S8 family serine peptidase [Rhodopseudomonas faecalis]PYF04537.1 hypothetical protein BJ122_103192 [Rhodopseudomonas faecalis]TAH65768.1 MAG: peptidase [Rhodopseudomonas palustris]